MNKLEALVGLNLVSDIGSIRLKKLLEYFTQPQDILKASAGKLTAVSGIGQKIANDICSIRKEEIDKEFALAAQYKLKIMTIDDEDYPQNLKHIPDPPIVLYIKGELKKEDRISIAIVGSRRASFYGLSCAEKFARDLAARGFTIVSGMARGIDTSSHRGALKEGGRTIAVIGSGFNHIYPPENKGLAEEIAENGAVISEFPIEAEPLKLNFPRRNRVISGLSLGVLVVEAARNSGALITADFALEQGREVFALPGKIDSGTSFGTNVLIKQGAKLVSSADDIMEEFNFNLPPSFEAVQQQSLRALKGRSNPEGCEEHRRRSNLNSEIASVASLPRNDDYKTTTSARNLQEFALKDNVDNEELILYELISKEPIQLDELAEKTNLGIPEIAKRLLSLEMKKLIRQLPGKQFIRN